MSKNFPSLLILSIISFLIGAGVVYYFISGSGVSTYPIDLPPENESIKVPSSDEISKICVSKKGAVRAIVSGYTSVTQCPPQFKLVYIRDYVSVGSDDVINSDPDMVPGVKPPVNPGVPSKPSEPSAPTKPGYQKNY